MKSRIVPFFLLVLCSVGITTSAFGWGWWAHKEIHRFAIRSLPEEMRPFFDANADSIVEQAVDPDRRVSSDKNEQARHYIDIDRYGAYPFAELPRNYDDAVKKFGKGFVDSTGTVPWQIARYTQNLADAMMKKDKPAILFCVSTLGHYVADAHVPLHAVVNYNGQLTNQLGIHARWETEIPLRFAKGYVLGPEKVEFIKDPLAMGFNIILESYRMADSVLKMELKAREGIAESDLYSVRTERGRTEYRFSDEYYNRYNKLLGGMVERRMKESISRVASYWYTAWVNAGKPQLPL